LPRNHPAVGTIVRWIAGAAAWLASSGAIAAPDDPKACLAEVVVQTTQLDRVSAALADVLRWRAVVRSASGHRREVLLGSASSDCGRVRLVELAGTGAEPMRPGAHWWDRGGAYALNVFVRDAAATTAEFRARGWVTALPMDAYEEKREGVVTAAGRYARMIGPDDLVIGFQQRIAPALTRWPAFAAGSHVENVMEIVDDLDAWLVVAGAIAAPDAARSALAERIVERSVKDSARGGLAFGLPRQFGVDADARQAILRFGERGEQMLTAWTFRSLHGEDHSARIDAAHAGVIALRIRVPDVEAVDRSLRERGVEFVRRDGVVLAPYGAVDTLTVTSAGGSSLRLEVVALRRGRR
jgi:hypothetical protein